MISSLALLQQTSFLLSLIGIIALIFWMIKIPEKRLYGVPFLVWFLHVFLFYIVSFFWVTPSFVDVPPHPVVFWSAVLRLQAVLTIVGGLIIYLLAQRKCNGNSK